MRGGAFDYWCRRLALSVRKHRTFLSLGYNCELAFQYNLRNGFVESGLFQWAYSYSLEDLIHAVEHLDLMFTGEVKDPNPLYEFAATRIREHGKAPMALWTDGVKAVDRETMEADRADLVGRIAHLREKFVRSLREGGALVMYKIRSEELLAPAASTRLQRLLAALRALGATDFDFVLVCEERCRGKVPILDSPRFFIRHICTFNPDDRVTDDALSDRYGWRLLFDEFRPFVRRRKTHKFKFEK